MQTLEYTLAGAIKSITEAASIFPEYVKAFPSEAAIFTTDPRKPPCIAWATHHIESPKFETDQYQHFGQLKFLHKRLAL